MLVKNNTHYFSEYTRVYNGVLEPNSFGCESSKRMGYFQRLWFEYAFTRKVNGIAFYYTLTYNDKSIPKYRGRNCFSYDDIRTVTNGRLSKVLLRKYGSVLRYFCACETGEGKGKRGLGNNPHYHFIFFVYSANDPKYPYVKISPDAFKDLMYQIWQGSSYKTFVPWQLAKFGHVQEGKFNGEVLSAECLKYVGKYVIKDANVQSYEKQLRQELTNEFLTYDITYDVLYEYYRYLKFTDPGLKDKYDYFDFLNLHQYHAFCHSTVCDKSFRRFMTSFCGNDMSVRFDLFDKWFHNVYVPDHVEQELSNYRNNWSPKARMSKSLGIYGLNFIKLVDGQPRVVLNTKNGYESQYPCLYYIRKLFYDVKICPHTGNPLYYLNDFGIKMKVQSLPAAISNMCSKTLQNISYKQLNKVPVDTYESYVSFDKMPVCNEKLDLFNDLVSRSDFYEIVRRYSVYRCVYQYRSFTCYPQPYLTEDCNLEDVNLDYSVFLHQNSYFLDYDEGYVYDMIEKGNMQLGFSCHPAFLPYTDYFKYLDKLNDVVDNDISNFRKKAFADKSDHQKRLSAYKYNCSFDFIPLPTPEEVSTLPPVTPKYPIYEQLSLSI